MQENMLNDQRRIWKFIVFGILTLGIYQLIFWWKMINDINTTCGYVEDTDSEKSVNYIVLILLTLVTLGIYAFVWFYKQGNRIKTAGREYGLNIEEKGSTYLLWIIFGTLLFGVGPIIALYLMICNLNKLCSRYNQSIAENYEPENPGGAGDDMKFTPPMPPTYPFIDPIGGTQQMPKKGNLHFIRGSFSNTDLELQPDMEVTIGRSSQSCQIVLPEQDISRRHCTIRYSSQEGCYYVTDYSTYGIRANDSQKLTKGVPARFPIGTKLSLGQGSNELFLGQKY